MPSLSKDDIERYIEDGFLLLEGLLSPSEVKTLKDEADRQRDEESQRRSVAPNSILAIHRAHYNNNALLKSFVVHERVADVLSSITSSHLRHGSSNVKVAYAILFLKPAGLPGQAWHQDEYFVPTRDRSLTAASICIDDFTSTNGCLQVIPGSHKRGYLYPMRPHQADCEFDENDECFGFDAQDAMDIVAPAGSVLFFNGYLLHRSLKNRSNGPRRSLVSHYLSSESLLPWGNFEDGKPVSMADNRKVVSVSGQDPYAWKGYEELVGATYLRDYEKH